MFGLPRIHHRPKNVRLETLVRLRWLAVLGQFAAVLVVHFGLEFDVPLWSSLAVIALAALLNIALRVGFPFAQLDVVPLRMSAHIIQRPIHMRACHASHGTFVPSSTG